MITVSLHTDPSLVDGRRGSAAAARLRPNPSQRWRYWLVHRSHRQEPPQDLQMCVACAHDTTCAVVYRLLPLSLAVYGPSMLCVSPITALQIDKLLALRAGHSFDFNDEDTEAGRGEGAPSYLFFGSHSTRCLDSSAWARKVKAGFEKFSPRNTKTPPRLLRSAFVTALRSDPNAPESVKEAASVAMKP